MILFALNCCLPSTATAAITTTTQLLLLSALPQLTYYHYYSLSPFCRILEALDEEVVGQEIIRCVMLHCLPSTTASSSSSSYCRLFL